MEEFGCLWSYQEVGHTPSSFSSSGSCFVCHLKVFFGVLPFPTKIVCYVRVFYRVIIMYSGLFLGIFHSSLNSMFQFLYVYLLVMHILNSGHWTCLTSKVSVFIFSFLLILSLQQWFFLFSRKDYWLSMGCIFSKGCRECILFFRICQNFNLSIQDLTLV